MNSLTNYKIKLIKLVNGEELLAETLVKVEIPVITLRNPVRVIVVPNKLNPSTPSVGFAPWAQFTLDDTFHIDKMHVIAIMDPIADFITQYKSLFSKIVTPLSSGLILPGS